jgi:hypothetical protein
MKFIAACCAAAALLPSALNAITIDLDGNTSFDGWENITLINFPGYGNFPGTTPWPAPIGSNVFGSGDATLNKTQNAASGGPYPGSASLYFGNFIDAPNTFGGTVEIADSTPVVNLKTIVFQLQIGEANGYSFFDNAHPVLTLNNNGVELSPTYFSLFDKTPNGTFELPEGGTADLYNNSFAFQWDVSEFSDPITSFAISFSGVAHSQVYWMQLDQSDAAYAESVLPPSVPEPSAALMALMGLSAGLLRRRRKS